MQSEDGKKRWRNEVAIKEKGLETHGWHVIIYSLAEWRNIKEEYKTNTKDTH